MSLNPLPFTEHDSKHKRQSSRNNPAESPLISHIKRPATDDDPPSSIREELLLDPDLVSGVQGESTKDYVALDMPSPGGPRKEKDEKKSKSQKQLQQADVGGDTNLFSQISPLSTPGVVSTLETDQSENMTSKVKASNKNARVRGGLSGSKIEPLISEGHHDESPENPLSPPSRKGDRHDIQRDSEGKYDDSLNGNADEHDYVPPTSSGSNSPLLTPDLSLPQEERLRGVDLYKTPSFSRDGSTSVSGMRSQVTTSHSSSSSSEPKHSDPLDGDENPSSGNDEDKQPEKSKKDDNIANEAMTFAGGLSYDPNQGSVSRMLREMRPEWVFITFGLICLAFASVCQLAVPKLMGEFIDRLKSLKTNSVQNILFLLAMVSCVNAVFNFGWMSLLWIAGDRVVTRLRKQAFDCIVHREISFFDTSRTGELISRLSSDVNSVNGALTTEIAELVQRTVLVTGGFAYMFYLTWDLTLISMALAPLLGLIGHRMAIYFHKLAWKANDQAAKANIVAEETVSCLKTVRSFAQERFMCDQYDNHCDQAFKIAKKQKIAKASQRTFVYLSGSLAVILVLWYGALKVKEGVMSAGDLLTFVLYGMQVGEKSGQIMDNWGLLKTAAGSCQRLFQLIDDGLLRKAEIAECTQIITLEDEERYLSQHPEYRVCPTIINKAISLTTDITKRKLLQLPIHFEDVTFAYPARSDKPVLTGLNLTLEPGKVIALVGTSGGGKSTIVSLLERFYKPTSGRILWGDVDINTLDFQWYHKQVGYVGQEPVLFCTTIRENILYGVKNNRFTDRVYTEKDVERVSRMANAHNFISAWPKGYWTVVGERGAQISGGQKQRIAIARAMLMDPPILLLDEATSALDNESERVVQAALDRLMVGRTTLMIAHRLSTVRNADLVVVVSGGKVVEKGTHEELMKLDGTYAKLVKPQLEMKSNRALESAVGPIDKDSLHDNMADENVVPEDSTHSRRSISKGGFVKLQDENVY